MALFEKTSHRHLFNQDLIIRLGIVLIYKEELIFYVDVLGTEKNPKNKLHTHFQTARLFYKVDKILFWPRNSLVYLFGNTVKHLLIQLCLKFRL